MRSAHLITAFMFSVLTAAAPVPELVYRANGRVKRGPSVSGKESCSAEPSVRSKESRNAVNRITAIHEDDHVDITHDYQLPTIPEVEVEIRSAEPINRRANSKPESLNCMNGRDVEGEDNKEHIQTRGATRNQAKRSSREKSVVPDEEIQASGAIRNQGSKRSAEPEPVVRPVKNQKRADDYDEDVEPDATSNQGALSVREETLSDEDVEARAVRGQGKRSVREKTSVPDDNLEARGAIGNRGSKRLAEPTVRPGNNGAICRPGHVTSKCGFGKRTTENDQDIEAFEVRGGTSKRDAAPEPGFRGNSKRIAQWGAVRGSN